MRCTSEAVGHLPVDECYEAMCIACVRDPYRGWDCTLIGVPRYRARPPSSDDDTVQRR